MSAVTRVRVPASSANLGPGFDTLGLALNLYLECRFEVSESLQITATGRDVDSIPLDETNLIWRTAVTVARSQQREMPPIRLEISNDIPIGKGLGSSGTALVAGVAIASKALHLDWDDHRILDEAARLEGHPDNVAAAVLGSIATATIGDDGVTRAVRIEMPKTFRVAVVCPDFVLPTNQMRSVLPDCYSREDVVFNLQRATLLVAGLATGNHEAFPAAFEDRLHQPHRMASVPGMEQILKLRAPGLLGCALSGAGPAILVFYDEGSEHVLELVRAEFTKAGKANEIVVRGVAEKGLEIT
ncbi:MAG: homoserine kinase [Acidobacteria bacterium]|nr:homoserine kinase [Acidobacteriota bacterium]